LGPTSLDVIVPTYNNLAELKECIQALEQQTGVTLRVLVCVDGSTDGTLDWLRTGGFAIAIDVLTHPDDQNRGRSLTRNLALPHLRSEYVLLLDSDMRLDSGAASRHCDMLVRRDCVSVGAIEYRNTSQNLWSRYLSTRGRSRYRGGARLPFNQFTTANSAMLTRDLVKLGGFDERIVGYAGEDTEFAYRLAQDADHEFIFNEVAVAWTVEDKTLDQALAQLRAYGATNLRYIHERHPAMPHVFMTDRAGSKRIRDRAFVATLNPLTDRVVDALLPHVPFALQRYLISYKVIRAVVLGYVDGGSAV
jgi:glycosyltransferase involved in cell wall biosynthesis